MTIAQRDAALKAGRLTASAEVRGGWPVPLAGATYRAVLAWLGGRIDPANWSLLAAVMSGAVFPLAIAYAAIFRNPFMKVKGPDQGAVYMAMNAMLLFWPAAIGALRNFNALTPLILAIGMPGDWPVFGWSYGQRLPFLFHVVVRAVVSFGIWQYMPQGRFTALPAAAAGIYLVTEALLFIDSARVARRLTQK
ncbi:MAG: hypothetical protein WEA77_07580 [Hyphomonas sp.]|uniref:DUF7010 family protein n=1 Tax=Hyphomonas sp. TaxID=87 RepID=UPI0034A0221D